MQSRHLEPRAEAALVGGEAEMLHHVRTCIGIDTIGSVAHSGMLHDKPPRPRPRVGAAPALERHAAVFDRYVFHATINGAAIRLHRVREILGLLAQARL